jgi:hypothetical protein
MTSRRLLGTFLPVSALLLGTFVLAWSGLGLIRPIFVIGCVLVSIHAKRRGAAVHLQISLVLFCLTPFLRRIVDFSAGYEPMGLMLTGPFLAILVPAFDLDNQAVDLALKPFFVVGACVTYAASITLFSGGELSVAASGSLKWIAPLLYGVWLNQKSREPNADIVGSAARMSLTLMPLLSVYGIFQYINPPDWDRYWMINLKMVSAGLPEPYEVHVFSTMNSPETFAAYAVFALLLIAPIYSGWLSALVSVPILFGVLLSLNRSAWIGIATGLIVFLSSPVTRYRATLLTLCGVGAILLAANLPPFDEVIVKRLATFSSGGNDGSVQARLAEIGSLLDNGTLVGNGFEAGIPQHVGGPPLVDGQIVLCWTAMGLVVAMLCLTAVLLAAWGGISKTAWSADKREVAVGAILACMVVQTPLAAIASGEMGVLFWGFVGIALSGPSVNASAVSLLG